MRFTFSKEGAVRFSSVVVAENATLIPLYTLRVPSKTLVELFLPGNTTEFVVQGDCYFGFQEFLFLFGGCHILSVSKLNDVVKL
jgi:hypothetical protein